MAKITSEKRSLPLRGSVLLFLALNFLISTITGLNFLSARENFPSWFGPVFLAAIGFLICVVCFYIWQLPRTLELVKPPSRNEVSLIWILLMLSIICTSALHKFYPFRPAIITYWLSIPDHLNLLKYNYILTAGSLLVVLVLAVLYSLGRREQAVTGLVILAAIMLMPNDNCGNYFNQPWIKWGLAPYVYAEFGCYPNRLLRIARY